MKRLNVKDFTQRLESLEERVSDMVSRGNSIQHIAEILEARKVAITILPYEGDLLKQPDADQMKVIAARLPNIPADRVQHIISEAVRWHNIVMIEADC